MDFRETVLRTRSCRRFDEQVAVGEDCLTGLIDLARMTASAGNLQKIRFFPVTGRDDCRAVTDAVGWAAYLTDWKGPGDGERPTAYLLLLSPVAGASPAIDIGIAAQTILLGATKRNLAGCIILNIDRTSVAKQLGIGEDMRIDIAIALGRPAETIRLTEVRDGNIRYYRDENDVHIVPKRSLSELIYRPGKS